MFYNILNAAPELKDRAIILNGVSKAYAMTGYALSVMLAALLS